MTKIGVISDIHGDAQALDQALAHLLSMPDLSQVVCLGDLVDKGPHCEAVVQAVAASGMICIMGNHDYDNVHGGQTWLRENVPPDMALYQSNLLSQASIDYLAQRPKTHRLAVNDLIIDLAHGSPRSTDEYVFRAHVQRILRPYLRSTISHALLLGHTHEPMLAWVEGRLIANPGSVAGAYSWGSRTFGVLDTAPLQFTVHDVVSGLPIILPD